MANLNLLSLLQKPKSNLPSSSQLVAQAASVAGIGQKQLPSSTELANGNQSYGDAPQNYRLRNTPGTIQHAMDAIRNRYQLSPNDEQTVKDYLWFRGGKHANIDTSTLYRALELVKERNFEFMRKWNRKFHDSDPTGVEFEDVQPKGPGSKRVERVKKDDSAWLDLAIGVVNEQPANLSDYSRRLTQLQMKVEEVLRKHPGHVRAIQTLKDIEARSQQIGEGLEAGQKQRELEYVLSGQADRDTFARMYGQKNPLERAVLSLGQGLQDNVTGTMGMAGAASTLLGLGDLGLGDAANSISEIAPSTNPFEVQGLLDQLFRVGGQIGGSVLTGGLAGLGKHLVGKAAVGEVEKQGAKAFLQSLKVPANMAVREGIIEGGSTYNDLKKAGKSDKEASDAAMKVFVADTIAGTILNRFGELAPDKLSARKIILAMPSEALEEAQQTITQNLASGRPWNDGLAEAAFVGALAGGLMTPAFGAGEIIANRDAKRAAKQMDSRSKVQEADAILGTPKVRGSVKTPVSPMASAAAQAAGIEVHKSGEPHVPQVQNEVHRPVEPRGKPIQPIDPGTKKPGFVGANNEKSNQAGGRGVGRIPDGRISAEDSKTQTSSSAQSETDTSKAVDRPLKDLSDDELNARFLAAQKKLREASTLDIGTRNPIDVLGAKDKQEVILTRKEREFRRDDRIEAAKSRDLSELSEREINKLIKEAGDKLNAASASGELSSRDSDEFEATTNPLEAELERRKSTISTISTNNTLAKPEKLTVEFGGKSYEVDSLEDAAAKWDQFRDTSDAGGSQIGDGLEVRNSNGDVVGNISYNGRIFKSDQTEVPTSQWARRLSDEDLNAQLKTLDDKANRGIDVGPPFSKDEAKKYEILNVELARRKSQPIDTQETQNTQKGALENRQNSEAQILPINETSKDTQKTQEAPATKSGYRLKHGNAALLDHEDSKYFVPQIEKGKKYSESELHELEKEVERQILDGKIIVVHSSWPANVAERVGVVPLRWGASKVLVGDSIAGVKWEKDILQGQEPFRAWRLWRIEFDPKSDVLVRPKLKNRTNVQESSSKPVEIGDNDTSNAGNQPEQLGTSSQGPSSGRASGLDEGTGSQRETPPVPSGPSESDGRVHGDRDRAEGEPVSGSGRSGDSELPSAADVGGSGFHRIDYLIPDPSTIGKGGFAAKRDASIAAVQTLREVESRGGKATEEEKNILAHFPGWGWTGNLLHSKNADPSSTNYKSYKAIRDVLTDEEFEAAKHATINSHFTDPKVIQALWKGVQQLGFRQGRALEPATGIGLIPALGPNSINWEMVELDSLSGRIAGALHSESNVHIKSFQDALIKGNYDLSISNVPFANFRVFDPKFQTLTGRPELLGSLHDYFIAKMISETRPGGLVVAITSRYTMDKQDGRAREWYASQAELLGAIRLPNDAFKENAGTDVVTDILFFRKLNVGEEPKGEAFVDLVEQQIGDGTALVNEYFERYPEMVLGTPTLAGKMTGRQKEYTLESNGDLQDQIDKALKQLPSDIYVAGDNRTKSEQRVVAGSGRRSGSIYKRDGKTFRNIDGLESAVEGLDKRETQKLDSFLLLRDARIAINEGMRTGASDAELKKLQTDLKKAYDAYVKKFGPVNKGLNQAPWKDDPDAYGVLALENWDSQKRVVSGLADIFTKRTVASDQIVNHANTPAEALFASLNNKGVIDFDEMKRVSGKTHAQLKDELVGSMIFYDQAKKEFVTAAEFGGGNVVKKMKESESAGDEKAVKFLESRRPKRVAVEDIDPRPGSPWIPQELYPQFVANLLSVPEREVKISYNSFNASYDVSQPRYSSSPGFRGTAARETYGTSRANAMALIQNMLNGKPARITDKVGDKDVLNEEETNAANAKILEIRQAWDEWVLSNADRSANLENVFNDVVNVYAPVDYDGSFLTLPGMNSDYTDRSHRKNSILRILMNPSTLLAHEVGTGKTATMQGAAMELRRTGLASKPVHVVKNGMLRQYVKEFHNLYPGARLLVISDKAMEPQNRKKTIAQIATGDWDSVIIPYSKFTRITTSPATQLKFYQDIVDEFEKEFEGEDAATVKQAGKSLEKVRNKIKAIKEKINNRSDDAVYWEELGIDALFVDEFHNFKNLFYITKNRVKGLGDPSGSQQAFDMLMKVRHVQKLKGRIVTATGTPISNTVAELHTMLKYLAPDLLKEQNMEVFDAWASTFATITRDVEQAITGEYKPSDRYSKFSNVPELLQQWSSVVDTIFTEDVKNKNGEQAIKVPYRMDLDGNRTDEPVIVECLPTVSLKSLWANLIKRAKEIKYPVQPGMDNMLSISTEYRKSVADIRLVDPSAADNPESKINKAASNIIGIHKKFASSKGTQIVFLDMGVPKKFSAKPKVQLEDSEDGAASEESAGRTEYDDFSLYEDLRAKLVAGGIKPSEVAFFQEAKSDAARLQLQEKVRNGEVRVLIGTTQLMGEGLNVQNKVVALHHMQPGWRPIELIQRNGRGFRQGNENKGVIELHYVMKDSFDSFMWGTNRRKARFIEQIARGDVNGARVIDDISDFSDQMTIEQLEMAASGNPLVGEYFSLEHKLRKLSSLRESFRKRQARIKADLENDRLRRIPIIENEIASLGNVVSRITIPADFEMKVGGKLFDKPKEAGFAIYDAVKAAKLSEDQIATVGSYAGLEVKVFRNRTQLGKDWYSAVLFDPKEKASVSVPMNAEALIDPEARESTAASLGSRIAAKATEFQSLLNKAEADLASLQNEIPKKEAELAKTFKDEDEFQTVQARYTEVRNAISFDGAQEGGGWGSSVKAVDEDGPVSFGSRKRKLPEKEPEYTTRGAGEFMHEAIEKARELGATDDDLSAKLTKFDDPDVIATRYVMQHQGEATQLIETPERMADRQRWADEIYGSGSRVKSRTAMVILGRPAAGKSTAVTDELKRKGVLVIDADDVKTKIPEFDRGFGSMRIHTESLDVIAAITKRAITAGDEIAISTLGASVDRVSALLDRLKRAGYSTQITYLHVNLEESVKRNISRARKGEQGLIDPVFILNDVKDFPEKTYNKLKSEFDGYQRFDTNGKHPKLDEEQSPVVFGNLRAGRAKIGPSALATGTQQGHELEGIGQGSGDVDEDLRGDRPQASGSNVQPPGNRGARIQPAPITGGTAKNLRDIIFDVADAFGVEVHRGKPKNKNWAGEYDPRTGKTLIRWSGDLDNVAHELAHNIDDQFGVLTDWSGRGKRSPYDSELAKFWVHGSVATSGPKAKLAYKRAEGLAEFLRAYIVNPEAAIAEAPKFYNYLTGKLPKTAWSALDSFSTDVRRWAGLPAHEQVASNVQSSRRQKKIGEKLRETLHGDGYDFKINAIDKLQTRFQDSLKPVMKAIDTAMQIGNVDSLLPVNDPAMLIRTWMGRNGKISNILEHGMVDQDLKRVTPGGLEHLMEPIYAGRTVAEAEALKSKADAWMIAERTIAEKDKIETIEAENVLRELNGEPPIKNFEKDVDRLTGIGAGIYSDQDVAQRVIEELKKDNNILEIQEYAARYRIWTDSLLRYMVDSGRMGEESYAQIKMYDIPYVALHRIFEGMEGGVAAIPSKGATIGNVADPVKRFFGSTREIRDPLQSLVMQTASIIKESDRNRAVRAFTDLLRGDRKMYKGDVQNLSQIGYQVRLGEPNSVKVFVNGKAEFWTFQKDVYESIKGIGELDVTNFFDQIARLPAKTLRAFVIYSPGFIARNPIRDTFHRSVVSKTGAGVRTVFKKQTKGEFANFQLSGGDQAGHWWESEESWEKAISEVEQHVTKDGRSIIIRLGDAAKGYKSVAQWSETRGRMDEFKTAYDHAVKVLGYDDVNALLYAGSQARDLLDYAIAGTWGRWINRYIPFTNASTQGLTKTIRAFRDDPAGATARWGLYVALPTIAVLLMNLAQGDDHMEEYHDQPDYIRDLFWNIKIAPNLWLRIPKPFEVGVMASGLERGIDKILGNQKAFDGYIGSALKAVGGPYADETTLYGPFQSVYEVRANRDFFRGKYIVPPYESELLLDLRKGTKNSSRLGQWIAKVFNADPRNVDHLIHGNFAEIGRAATALSDIGREDKSRSVAQWLGVGTGMFVQSPAYNSKSVQWVLETEESIGVRRDDSLLADLIDEYFKADTDERRDAIAKQMRLRATGAKEALSGITIGALLKEAHKSIGQKLKPPKSEDATGGLDVTPKLPRLTMPRL